MAHPDDATDGAAAPTPVQQVSRAMVHEVKLVLVRSGPLGRRTFAGLIMVRRAWRRSLGLRMGLITFVISGLMVGGFGVLLADRTTTAQINGTARSVYNQLSKGQEYATDQLSGYAEPSSAVTTTIGEILNQLQITPQQGGGTIIAMTAEKSNDARLFQGFKSAPDLYDVSGAITPELRQKVAGNGSIAHQIVSADIGDGRHTYLVYGTPVPTKWGQIELYYIAPMDLAEQMTAEFRNTIALL